MKISSFAVNFLHPSFSAGHPGGALRGCSAHSATIPGPWRGVDGSHPPHDCPHACRVRKVCSYSTTVVVAQAWKGNRGYEVCCNSFGGMFSVSCCACMHAKNRK